MVKTYGSAPYYITGAPRQEKKKKSPNERQIKAPEKILLSNEEIANPSDAKLKTLVIRKLTELVEYSHILEGKMTAMKSEIKENV